VKDQYVGDINDFEKYAVLRSLATASGLPLVVCWMLTAADDSGEGANTGYLHDAARYRHLDPHVFDRLAQIVAADERSVAAVERHGVLDEATFVGRPARRPSRLARGVLPRTLERRPGSVAGVLRSRHRPRRKERP
jgi:hypothetical protein